MGYRIPEAPKVELAVMAETMAGFDDYQWGRYAFSREPLEGRFDEEEKRRYTEEANRCGREWARDLAARYGEKRPRLLAPEDGTSHPYPGQAHRRRTGALRTVCPPG